jgi:large subunit ribosomal protein L10
MNIAISGDESWQPMEEFLGTATAFLLTGEEIGAAVKAYKGFQKDTKKTEVRGGVMEGRALTKDQVEALGDLPTKDELYAQIAGSINALATKLAVGIKEVPSGLARGIKAVSEKEQ